MATQGGPGVNVVVDTTRARAAGPALPVAVMPDGYPVEGDAALAVYVVAAGASVQGGPAIPVVVAAAGGRVEGGSAIPVYVVSGSLSTAVAPVNTALPAISGTTELAATLTATTGTWSNTPTSYAYQWKRNGSSIGGATNSTYVLQAADLGATITVVVTATNAGGSASATSAGTAIPNYLLLDRFVTNATAPLTSPRTCEPGPDTLVLTDTANLLSISSNTLVRVSGAAVSSFVSGTTFARVAGRGAFGNVTNVTSGDGVNLGWVTGGQWALNNGHQLETANGSAKGGIIIASSLVPVNMRLGVIHNGSRSYYVIKSTGTLSLPNWTMLAVGEINTGSAKATWLATQTSTDSTLRNFQVIDLPSPWNVTDGVAVVAVANTSAGQTMTANSGNDTVEHRIVAQAGVTQELMVRRTDDNNCIIIRMDQAGSTAKVIEKNAGVEVEKLSVAQTWVAATTYKIYVVPRGNQIGLAIGTDNNQWKGYATSSFNQTATGVKVSHAGTQFYIWPYDISALIPAWV